GTGAAPALGIVLLPPSRLHDLFRRRQDDRHAEDFGRLLRQVPLLLDLGVAVEDRRPVLEKAGLTLQLDTPDTPIWVHGDATRLAPILNNLLHHPAKLSH